MLPKIWPRLALTIGIAAPLALADAAEIRGVRASSGPISTRVVLDVSEPAGHRMFMLANPSRVVVDLPGMSTPEGLPLPEARGFLSRVRIGNQPGDVLRVVLDVKPNVTPTSFVLGPEARFGHRIVVDLKASKDVAPAEQARAPVAEAEPTRAEPPQAGPSEAEPPRAESIAPAPEIVMRAPERASGQGRDLVIAIDAGHGGKDPGAIGPKGAREKDIVLSISDLLAREVDSVPGMRSLLIRDEDFYVAHRERMAIAHRAEADFFISVHADAARNSRARGATVYALSTKRASDEAARRLAERENASDLIGGVSLSDKDAVLAKVLLDLSQSAAISASMTAGEHIIGELGAVTRIRKTTVQQAPFIVLTSPDIPSLLIETGYISNPGEESVLRASSHQAKLARALRDGIVGYFRSNPPPGTYFAMNPRPPSPARHVIARGETLSQIAARYEVSLASLRRANSISGDRIRAGQVLTIPTS